MHDVVVVDGREGVGTFDVLAGAGRTRAEFLAQAAEFFDVGGVACWSQFLVAAELAVFHVLAGVGVEDEDGGGPFAE